MMTLYLSASGRVSVVETSPDPDGWDDRFAQCPPAGMDDDMPLDFGDGRRMTMGEFRAAMTGNWDDPFSPCGWDA